MRLLPAILLSLPSILHPCCTWGSTGNPIVDAVGEYEGSSTYGMKIFLLPQTDSGHEVPAPDIATRISRAQLGFFLGGKLSTNKADGEKYNWSQSRAEGFYGSHFSGYSDRELYGLNCGVTYSLWRDHFYIYSGLGFIQSKRYRQYYDDTFTEWSNKYYIEDGMREEVLLDVIIGGNIRIKQFIVDIGYSTAVSNVVLGVGIRF